MDVITSRTPCGRVPNTPLRNPRHEAVAHALVQGVTCREAGVAAGYKDGPGLTGNISRLRRTAVVRERIAEIAARAGELAEVNDAWILSRIKQLADCSIADFLLFDADGHLVLDNRGHPIVDLSRATDEQMRTLMSLERDARGRFKLRMRDPIPALKLLAKNRGFLRDKFAPINDSGEVPTRVFLISDRPMSDEEMERRACSQIELAGQALPRRTAHGSRAG
jgi:hypothetical protein